MIGDWPIDIGRSPTLRTKRYKNSPRKRDVKMCWISQRQNIAYQRMGPRLNLKAWLRFHPPLRQFLQVELRVRNLALNFDSNRFWGAVVSKQSDLSEMYTVNHKKTWHFIFDYNYDISWPIFTLFAANETGINALQWDLHIFQIHLSCVYTLPCKTFSQHETSNSAWNIKFWNQSSQCFIV